MNEFLIFCGISLFLNIVNGDTPKKSTNIDCYEDKSQKINEDLLKKINYMRSRKKLNPLVLNKRLITGSVEWSKHLAEINKVEKSNADCKYGEFTFTFHGFGSYTDNRSDPILKWQNEITLPTGKLYSRTVRENQLFWEETKEVGCGICSYQEAGQKKQSTVATCRVRPSAKSVLDVEEE